MKNNSCLFVSLVLLAACTSVRTTPIPYLFVKTDKQGLAGALKQTNVSASINVSNINLALLKDTTVREIMLPMPDDKEVVLQLDSVSNRATSSDWTGKIKGDSLSFVFLTFTDQALNGTLNTRKDIYRIGYIGNEVYQVGLVDQRKMTDADQDATVPNYDTTKNRNADRFICDDPPSSIDVLVVYTQAAESGAGGPAGMNALINQCISLTNLCYSNSGITQRINLVHSEKVNYTESGNSRQDRDALQNPTDGVLDNVPPMRDAYGADIAVLITETEEGTVCGMAYIMDPVGSAHADYGYAVLRRSCTVDNKSFPHELGHIMGARHENDPKTTPFPYGHGYQVLTPANPSTTPWRTIMSKADGTIRLAFFSNPGIRYPGSGSGNNDAAGNAISADNHSVLNNTAATVARFRCSTKK